MFFDQKYINWDNISFLSEDISGLLSCAEWIFDEEPSLWTQ